MYKNEVVINGKKFMFNFTHEPYYVDENIFVMGFPYNMKPKSFNETKVNEIKGYYIYVRYESNYIEIISDIIANYRTYYMEKDGILYFSNDFLYLFNMLGKEEREPNKFEIEYWDKHRYTTGGETLCAKIHKIKPAHIYKFYPDKIEEKLYFKDIQNKPNRKKHFEEVLADLRDTVSLIKKMPQKKFLLFSGGADSTLCVKLLQEQNVEFIPVFAKHTPTNSMNYDDILKVQCSAKLLDIEPVEIEVNTTKKIDKQIVDTMFMDRNISQLFYEITHVLKEKYGNDIIFINGQAADAIFGYGPTEIGFRNVITRHFLFRPFSFINRISLFIFQKKRENYRKFRVSKTEDEYLAAFFDEKFYMPLIDKSKSEFYFQKINDIISGIRNNITNKNALMMYLKADSYMQGSDNYVNVQSCETNGIKALFLFVSPHIISSTIENTDYIYEILHPKSIVYRIQKDVFNYTMPNIRKKKNYTIEVKQEKSFGDYEKEIYQNFYNKINSLEFVEPITIGEK